MSSVSSLEVSIEIYLWSLCKDLNDCKSILIAYQACHFASSFDVEILPGAGGN